MSYELNRFKIFFENIVTNHENNNHDFKSINILVDAPFGCGKTTLKNEFLNYINQENNNYLVVDVNIWNNTYLDTNEVVFTNLFQYYEESGSQKFKNIMDDILNENKNSSLKIFQFCSNLFNTLKEITKDIKNKHLTEEIEKIQARKIIESAVNKIINYLLNNKNNSYDKIVFLFDELDRCSPEFMNNFFMTLKNTLNKENVINIIFANKNYINISLDENYRTNNNLKNEEETFFDKFINYSFIMNKPTIANLIYDEFENILKECKIKNIDVERLKQKLNFWFLNSLENETDINIWNILNGVSYREFHVNKSNLRIFIRWLSNSLLIWNSNDWDIWNFNCIWDKYKNEFPKYKNETEKYINESNKCKKYKDILFDYFYVSIFIVMLFILKNLYKQNIKNNNCLEILNEHVSNFYKLTCKSHLECDLNEYFTEYYSRYGINENTINNKNNYPNDLSYEYRLLTPCLDIILRLMYTSKYENKEINIVILLNKIFKRLFNDVDNNLEDAILDNKH